MKNKGFTLIELLSVIVILAVIALITTFSVSSILSDSKDSLSDKQKDNIEEAAEAYYIKEGMSINNTCISVEELIDKGYIEGNVVIDPEDKEEMVGYVKISYEANQYSYTYQEDSCKVCKAISGDGSKAGNEISCTFKNSTENFYVISNDGTNIEMLSKYNLNVGNIVESSTTITLIDNPTGLQSENAKGYVSSSSTKYGTVVFGTSTYWYDSENSSYTIDSNYTTEGRTYPYVYGNYQQNAIYPYVKAYENYLKENGLNVIESKLLSYEQAINLKCSENSCSSAPSWLYLTSYWLGSAQSNEYIYIIGSDGRFGYTNYNNVYNTGVRPIVTVSVNYIK